MSRDFSGEPRRAIVASRLLSSPFMLHRTTALVLTAILTAACGVAMPPGSDTDASAGNDAASNVGDANATDGPVVGAVTWSGHVAPVVFQHCVSCHRGGGIAPFSLERYELARDRARMLSMAASARTMPPTLVDNSGTCNRYEPHSADWLTDAEIATLRAWSEQGAPEGDPARAPAVPPPPGGLANVTARVDVGTTFMPDATRMDELRCFVVDAPSADDRFVTAFQVEPGDTRVVHHVILYALETAAGAQTVTDLDARDARAGYDCPGGPMAAAYPVVLWAPGGGATQLPAGTGLRYPGGRKLVLQMHYNMAQGSFPDRTRVALTIAPTVANEARMVAVGANALRLPPRMTNAIAEGSRTIPMSFGRTRIWGVAPHMHTLGTDAQLTLRNANRCAMDLHHWNFHWQRMFFYQSPLDVDAGETLNVRCQFDTSSKNEVTTWGEGTDDEMCLVYAYVTAR
jgi:hypothetical protein